MTNNTPANFEPDEPAAEVVPICVMLESPYWSPRQEIRDRNIIYLHRCMLDSFSRGEAPFASHWMYPTFLPTEPGEAEENVPNRELGIACRNAWSHHADTVVLYTDYGISNGMVAAIKDANAEGIPLEFRTIGLNEAPAESAPLDEEGYR